jgi:hypothetical protein
MKYRHPFISYLKVGYLLHFMTAVEIILLVVLYNVLNLESWIDGPLRILKTMALVPFFSMPLFAQLDARSRYQNYKQLKDQLYRFGFRERIMKPVLKSRCQRDAAIAASDELGIGAQCKCYFRQSGYRWYHLLPDFFFRKPQFLLSWYFWKTTFFVREYRPMYDYRSLNTGAGDILNYAVEQR